MAARYQFQLIDHSNGRPLGQPLPLPAPYPFHVGDAYIFGPNNSAQISAVGHYFTGSGQDIVYTTILRISRSATLAESENKAGGDPVIPWPWPTK